MATEISWLIEQIEVYPDVNGYKNVVFRCNWRANAVDGNYKSTVFGIEIIDFVEGGNFTEYNDLKSDQVIGWVKNKMGSDRVGEIESLLTINISDMINPPILSLPLPW